MIIKNKCGTSSSTAIGLVLFIIVLAVGALVISSIATSIGNDNPTLVAGINGTAAMNLTGAGGSMFQNMVGLIPVLGIVFIAGIVIFFVIRGLGGSAVAGGGKAEGGNF